VSSSELPASLAPPAQTFGTANSNLVGEMSLPETDARPE
jgi:hypothetical protein